MHTHAMSCSQAERGNIWTVARVRGFSQREKDGAPAPLKAFVEVTSSTSFSVFLHGERCPRAVMKLWASDLQTLEA